MSPDIIRRRLKSLREDNGLTQAQLAERMGFNDRQTLAAIEAGDRRISAEELVRAAEVFTVDLGFFSDPFRLAGEGRFSWRQHSVDTADLLEFERQAGSWIAMYRELCVRKGDSHSPLLVRAGLTDESSYEEAQALGERLAEYWNLGLVPSSRLRAVVETELQTLVLHVDAIEGISGAACQLTELNVILVNRNEAPTRRNFDLAHELFHLLTWDALPPNHIESFSPTSKKEKHVERLAENFAAALLMPSYALEPFLSRMNNGGLIDWINETATALGVSSQALKWRLVAIGRLSRAEANRIDDSSLRNNGRSQSALVKEPLFSGKFVEVLSWGLDNGSISVRRAATILAITVDELYELFGQYNIDPPFEL